LAKKSNLIKLGDAISQILKEEHLDVKISRFTVKNSWKEIVGEMIAKNTTEISFREKTIFITLSSAALKQELLYRKEEIVNNINNFCRYRLIDTLVIK